MSTYKAEIKNIADALYLYKKHLETTEPLDKAKQVYDQTLTALTRYTLPGWGHPLPAGRKPTRLEKESAELYLVNASIDKLKKAQDIQERTFEMLKIDSAQRYTYRSRLNKFINWIKKQGWLAEVQPKINRIKTSLRSEYGGTGDKRLTNRKALPEYALKIKDAPLSLVAEIEQFKKFMLDKNYPGRTFPSIKNGYSANKLFERLYQIIGWFSKHRSFSGDFTLELLVPKNKHTRDNNLNCFLQETKHIAKYMDSWICDFINFLEIERNCKSNSIVSGLRVIILLTKYHYIYETEERNYSDIPAIKMLRDHINTFSKKSKKEKPASDESLKWLDMPDILKKIVLPLREETNYKGKTYAPRRLTTIAASFQDFILWGVFTFRPPRRQHEWRECKIALICSLKDKPKENAHNNFIHPLPLNRNKEKEYGYLYKSDDGKWYKDTPPESYKTGEYYGYQQIEIPNPLFPDGKYFYDYLEAYLYGYYRDKKGNWLSGGQVNDYDLLNKSGQWYSLRMAFNPVHNYLFFGPQKVQPYTPDRFTDLFSVVAHRLTGKLVTPHLLRDIYATWFLDQGYTSDRISSLAYAMGHSEQMLRETYDRRKPEQRNRPIEDEMTKIVAQMINGDSLNAPRSVTKKPAQPDISTIIAVLTPEQKQQLGIE